MATVSIRGHALELAERMVTDGYCSTLDEAVERSVAIAALHDANQADVEASWSPAFVEELRATLPEGPPSSPPLGAGATATVR